MVMDGVVKEDVCKESRLVVSEPAIGHTPLLTSNERDIVSLNDEPHSDKENIIS